LDVGNIEALDALGSSAERERILKCFLDRARIGFITRKR